MTIYIHIYVKRVGNRGRESIPWTGSVVWVSFGSLPRTHGLQLQDQRSETRNVLVIDEEDRNSTETGLRSGWQWSWGSPDGESWAVSVRVLGTLCNGKGYLSISFSLPLFFFFFFFSFFTSFFIFIFYF